MDKRTLLIIAALLLPVAVVIILAQLGGPSSPDANTAARQEQASPAGAAAKSEKPLKGRTRPAGNLPSTETRTNDKKDSEPRMAARVRPPRNLEEARARAKQRLADLEKMTEEEWQAEIAQKQRDQERWMRLPPERKMDMLGKQQQQQQLRDAETFIEPKEQSPAR